MRNIVVAFIILLSSVGTVKAETFVTCGAGEFSNIGCNSSTVEPTKIVEQQVKHVVVDTSTSSMDFVTLLLSLAFFGGISIALYKLTYSNYILD